MSKVKVHNGELIFKKIFLLQTVLISLNTNTNSVVNIVETYILTKLKYG